MESRNKEITLIENDITNDTGAEETSAPVQQDEKKENIFKRIKASGFFTKPFKLLLYVFAASLTVYLLSRFSPAFAELWTIYPAQLIRFILAKLTGWIPFSFAECLIVSLPILAIAYIVVSTVSTKRDESMDNFFKWLRPLISVILVIVILFFIGFGPAYGRYKLSKNLDIEQSAVSADELFTTASIVSDELRGITDLVSFDLSGASIMPYDYQTLVKKMNESFDKYAEDADYISHFRSSPKAIALSGIMTYTHISGVYTFMTGESNINTNYPDFLIPYTMAHEMAHQRGIAREDEANFVAFLVCIASDDDYIRYCGYANMLNYLNSALAKADSALYKELLYKVVPHELLYEFVAYSAFFDKYRDSTASEVTGAVNDTFLQSQGQQAGTKSYGLVVDLAVAYYKAQGE
ncbi:MAG: DUF3810 domain-containing protein [Clostridia bacterium]|nr:DUF3810 domain-containing protein [Clostridia bacterium]